VCRSGCLIKRAASGQRTYSVVDEFLRLASTTFMSHGAFIDKYIGDAVMALFNVPIKRVDHAAAAVAASAKLQELLPELSRRLGMPLHASIGIASGFARVGRLGSDDIRDYTAIGDVVNQAARLQAQAGPTEILVSQDVYREVASAYPGVSAETLVLKGFPQRTVAYRLNGKPRSALSAASWMPFKATPTVRRVRTPALMPRNSPASIRTGLSREASDTICLRRPCRPLPRLSSKLTVIDQRRCARRIQ
jgi:class 3 adenylate cyclase